MSNRKPKRKRIKVHPALLQEQFRIASNVWRVNGLQITLNPTKGYSIWKLPKEWFKKAAEVNLTVPTVTTDSEV